MIDTVISSTRGGGTAAGVTTFDAGTATWTRIAESTASPNFTGVGVAVTSDDLAHAAYWGNSPDGGRGVAITTMATDGGLEREWILQSPSSGTGGGDLLKLVAQGPTLHALTRTTNNDAFRLLYGQRTGTGWLEELPMTGARVGNPAGYDLAVAANGTVHVAFQVTNAMGDAGTTAALVHGQRTGASAWTTTTIAVSTRTVANEQTLGRSLALTLDAFGEPVIAFEGDPFSLPDGGLGYTIDVARRSGGLGGAFAIETASDTQRHSTSASQANPLTVLVEPDGSLLLGYRRSDVNPFGSLTNGFRTLRKPAGGSWGPGPLPAPGENVSSYADYTRPRFVLGPGGARWLVTSNASNNLLLYRLSAAGIERFDGPRPTDSLNAAATFCDYAALAFTSAGRPRVVCRSFFGDAFAYRVYFGTFE
jgi:hypothetical protein